MSQEKPKTLPKKPDEKSHPDPLKRFAALKEWRKVVNKITGEEEMMKWRPEKTFDKVEKKVNKSIQKETEAIKREIGEVTEKRKKVSSKEQLKKLKDIRKKNKEKREKEEKEKKEKEKKIG